VVEIKAGKRLFFMSKVSLQKVRKVKSEEIKTQKINEMKLE